MCGGLGNGVGNGVRGAPGSRLDFTLRMARSHRIRLATGYSGRRVHALSLHLTPHRGRICKMRIPSSGVISDRGKVVSHPGASQPESSSHPAEAYFSESVKFHTCDFTPARGIVRGSTPSQPKPVSVPGPVGAVRSEQVGR
jgi:hypothetical protein